MRIDTAPDPAIEQAGDAIIREASSGICGSIRTSGLADAPAAYETFRKQDSAFKVLINP